MRLDAVPAGFRLLGPPGSNHPRLGNLVFRCELDAAPAILKVYRVRRGRWREGLADFSQRVFEGKRGARPARRRETELAALSAWRRHGFEAPRVLEGAAPAWIGGHPFLFMEYVEGVTLLAALWDPAHHPLPELRERVGQLGAETGRRHRCALEEGEPLLVQEHPAIQHVLVSEGRLVTFDLENAYAPGFPVPSAIAQELASTLRWLERTDAAETPLFDAFLDAYGETAILRDAVRVFFGPSLRWRIYRRRESSKRGASSKTATMRRLAERLGTVV